MKKKRYRLSKVFVYILHILAIITFFFVAFTFQIKKVEDKVVSSISVVENDNTDYKVYYSRNIHYTDSYIKNSGGNYVKTQVENIAVDFDYMVNLTELASGKYNYNITGAIYAYDPDDSLSFENENVYLWKKDCREENLIKSGSFEINNNNNYNIKEHVDIDFQRYVAEYNSYSKDNPTVLMDGTFVITMEITSNLEYENINNINFNKVIKLEVPLSEPTFKIKQDKTQKSDVKKYDDVFKNDKKRTIIKIMRIFSWTFEVILVIRLIYYYYQDVSSKSLYSRKLNKILSTYDSIIVNISSKIALDDLNVIKVNTFSEMVDAQSEVRLPINFYENKKEKIANFILVSNNIAWVYTLKESDLIDEDE